MAFYKNNSNYSAANAQAALNNEELVIAGLVPEKQVKFVDNKPTDEITGYQVWVATKSHNPFKVKLPADYKVDLSSFTIGDSIEFENLEAIEIKFKIFFRADGIKKDKL